MKACSIIPMKWLFFKQNLLFCVDDSSSLERDCVDASGGGLYVKERGY